MGKHGSCLAIVNTKRDALAIYAQWKEQLKTLEEPMEYGVPRAPEHAYVPGAPA